MTPALFMDKAMRCLKTADWAYQDGDMDGACNRAYYAMFNAAHATLQALNHPEAALAKTHSGLISAFGEHAVKTGQLPTEHGRAFAEVSKRRMVADYDGDGMSGEDAEVAIRKSTAFVEAVTALLQAKNG